MNKPIVLNIPGLPPTAYGPNRRRSTAKAAAPIIRKIKVDFSRWLEDNYPPIERPESPLALFRYEITFVFENRKRMDPTNLWGRMKYWEDVLKDERIIKDDSFNEIDSLLFNKLYGDNAMTRWVITPL